MVAPIYPAMLPTGRTPTVSNEESAELYENKANARDSAISAITIALNSLARRTSCARIAGDMKRCVSKLTAIINYSHRALILKVFMLRSLILFSFDNAAHKTEEF